MKLIWFLILCAGLFILFIGGLLKASSKEPPAFPHDPDYDIDPESEEMKRYEELTKGER